ncbi:hypothetical protein SNOG_15463 [Parastagonospora nodorum SN15]|uniref:Uncharacterized protein n=1 Tax=Phaeosphaeria nodorum (strain SN15 / ATCC MYA-4574 / FGSC 10173) TaxID=321614 RepID=Q0TYB7_PHANO|nr:hypothetical protein SNOG_15463 [Parastagonospora nodorum SN15]EAT77128.1 hypothetical protein SNOG_15463 [Parastagonospora nodorum SN15]
MGRILLSRSNGTGYLHTLCSNFRYYHSPSIILNISSNISKDSSATEYECSGITIVGELVSQPPTAFPEPVPLPE